MAVELCWVEDARAVFTFELLWPIAKSLAKVQRVSPSFFALVTLFELVGGKKPDMTSALATVIAAL